MKSKTFDELTAREIYEIVRARQEVFLMEQRIVCRDFDGVDYDALHCFIERDGRVCAYLRAYEADGEVHIGRVLTIPHGEGLGRALMEFAMPRIKEHFGCDRLTLHSQCHAEGFYGKLGFVRVGDVFLEEGIEHIKMNAECRVPNVSSNKTVDNCFLRSECAETRSNASEACPHEQNDYVSRDRMQNEACPHEQNNYV